MSGNDDVDLLLAAAVGDSLVEQWHEVRERFPRASLGHYGCIPSRMPQRVPRQMLRLRGLGDAVRRERLDQLC